MDKIYLQIPKMMLGFGESVIFWIQEISSQLKVFGKLKLPDPIYIILKFPNIAYRLTH